MVFLYVKLSPGPDTFLGYDETFTRPDDFFDAKSKT